LANYLPYLNLLQELLREHADQILPHTIAISVKPGDLVLLKDFRPSPLGPWWTGPHLVILTTPTTVKLNGIPQWQHLSNIAHQLQTLPLQQRMSTLAYCWAPRGYASPANSLLLLLLHKFLVLIWLSIFCHRWI
jgi:hypothetical protein